MTREVNKLDVLVDGHLIGWLQDTSPLSFVYSGECLSGKLESPFAAVIPVAAGEICTQQVEAYFENLLPEGDQRKALEQAQHVSSVFGMLSKVGWDTAGSLIFMPRNIEANADDYITESWEGLAKIMAGQRTFKQAPNSAISGAQYKLLISLDNDGNPLLPKRSAPSTHILKPNIVRPGQDVWASAINETILMRMADICKLTVAEVTYQNTVKSCLVKRYDRCDDNGRVKRINQSDFCQLMGKSSTRKYECDGGPSFADCYTLTKTKSANPVEDCERLLKWLFFNLYTGNNDSHAKNLSILLEYRNHRLAPFYDLMCTTVYPGFKNEFAFKVGSTDVPGEMQRSDLTMLAASVGVSEKYLFSLAKEIARGVDLCLEPAIDGLKASFSPMDMTMAERIGHKIRSTCQKMSPRLRGQD